MRNGLPRILIVRLSAIGDVVRVLPVLHALRKAHPNAQIDWVVEAKAADILQDHPELDDVLIFERSDSVLDSSRKFMQLRSTIRKRRYDVILDFHGLFKTGALVQASKAPERYGFARPRSQEGSWLAYNHRVKLPSRHLNRVEENFVLAEAFCEVERSGEAVIALPPHMLDEVDDYCHDTFDGGKRIIVVHAPVERPEKQWPLVHFAELCDLLLADGRFEVVLTYGPGQRAIPEAILEKARRKPAIAPDTPTLRDCAALIGHAALFVGGDTGPMHIAAAMDVPVVVIFGGTDPRQHAPYMRKTRVLAAGEGAVSLDKARKRLNEIQPETVYDACIELLRER